MPTLKAIPILSLLTGKIELQVNMCQKLPFFNQLSHNITWDCSLNPPKHTSSEHVVYKYSKQKNNLFYTTCSELVFFREFNEQSLLVFCVNWCKNEGFWKRFTCTYITLWNELWSLWEKNEGVKIFVGPLHWFNLVGMDRNETPCTL